jgi:hypothetical protein
MKSSLTKMLAALAATFAVLATSAQAAEVGGVKFDDKVKVAGKDLAINGLGIRFKAVFKVYAMALYLPKKQTTADAVLATDGPRRVSISMLREVSGEDFGESFMAGITKNTSKDDRKKFVKQIARMGEVFANRSMKAGDTITIDWIPGTGMVAAVNGTSIGDPFPELEFYNAVLNIWLGDSPADVALKPLLLGQTPG